MSMLVPVGSVSKLTGLAIAALFAVTAAVHHQHHARAAPGPVATVRHRSPRHWHCQHALGLLHARDRWGTPYAYACGPHTFLIVSAGPDRHFGTVDDVLTDHAMRRL